MADHCRKQIRDALAAGLGAMASVNSIHTGRVVPLDGSQLPALLIYTNEESAEDHSKAIDQTRDLMVAIEGHAQGGDVVDVLDAIALEVEGLFYGAVPAWVKAVDLMTTTVELSGDAVQPAGFIRLEFNVRYHVNRLAPDVPV